MTISRPRLGRFQRNLAWWRSSTLLTVPTVKNLKILKSTMVAAAILKNEWVWGMSNHYGKHTVVYTIFFILWFWIVCSLYQKILRQNCSWQVLRLLLNAMPGISCDQSSWFLHITVEVFRLQSQLIWSTFRSQVQDHVLHWSSPVWQVQVWLICHQYYYWTTFTQCRGPD